MRRGDIIYIEKSSESTKGSEMWPNRHAVIVSNNMGNKHSPTIEIVYLSTHAKKDFLTHVKIRTAPSLCYAVCEQITTISKSRVENIVSHITYKEMKEIEKAMLFSLGMNKNE